MYYLDYDLKSHIGEMRNFAYSRFGHGLDYDMNDARLRIYFKCEEELSFFMLYWTGNKNTSYWE